MVEIERVVEITRSWIGTPYHHQASLKGVGADCIGLVHGVYREIYGRSWDEVPDYSPTWGDADGVERMMAVMDKYFIRGEKGPGAVIGFRLGKGRVLKHAAIMTSETTAVHSYAGHAVAEFDLGGWYMDRIDAAYRWPDA